MTAKPVLERGRRTGPTVLLIGVFEKDQVPFLGSLCSGPVEAFAVGTCTQALNFLRRQTIPVVICERDLPDGTWRDILDVVKVLPDQPALIVTCRLADDELWVEVMSHGGYDVLPKPLDYREAARTIDAAWQERRTRQRQSELAMAVGRLA